MFRITALSLEYFISDCWDIARNSLVKRFQHWGDVFSVDFAIGVTKLPSVNWTNVFHFTADGNDGKYGNRIPTLFVNNDPTAFPHTDGFFQIGSAVNGEYNYNINYGFVLGKLYYFAIKQYEDMGKYFF